MIKSFTSPIISYFAIPRAITAYVGEIQLSLYMGCIVSGMSAITTLVIAMCVRPVRECFLQPIF